MSIYVAITCLGWDDELLRTVRSCIKTAENQEDLYFGVAIIGEQKLYDDFASNFSDNPNVKFQFFPYEEQNIGVGIGRHLAMSFYKDQDYVLQIDSHSRMYKGWDKYLIDKFKEAQELSNNKKVILTGTPAHYAYREFEPNRFTEVYNNQFLGYSFWIKRTMSINKRFITWSHSIPSHLSEDLSAVVRVTGFSPAPKICAAFIFSNQYFAKNRHLDTNIKFWEEEIVQTIELIDNGFTIIYPGEHPVISHLYKNDINEESQIGKRHNLFDVYRLLGKTEDDLAKETSLYFDNYLDDENNKYKIDFFEKYNEISYEDQIFDEHTYPKKYANIGFLPL